MALLVAIGAYAFAEPTIADSWYAVVAWCLLILATTSFAAMNFTGATTYTSLSGVRKEMRLAVPIQALCAVFGIAFWLIDRCT